MNILKNNPPATNKIRISLMSGLSFPNSISFFDKNDLVFRGCLTLGSDKQHQPKFFSVRSEVWIIKNVKSSGLRYSNRREFLSNQPHNLEAPAKAYDIHQALLLSASLLWRPGLKYGVRNGRKYPLTDTAPLLKLTYNKGIRLSGMDEDAADFDQIEVGMSHLFNFGISGKLDFNIQAGTFLNSRQVYFMDYKHFGGNRTIFSNMGAARNYRFLDYYRFSTSGDYFSSILHYQFRKFLFTQLPMLRFSGVRENLFFNYLKTAHSPHYTEIGYSLDNLFRIFRVEFGAGFENGEYSRGGLRLGVATFININVGE